MKTLTLTAAVRHNGTFQCIVNNTCGRHDDNVSVKVEGSFEIAFCRQNVQIVIICLQFLAHLRYQQYA